MKWIYRRYEVEKSRICPAGIVYRPEAKLRISGTAGEAYVRALIDTGADHTIVPFSIAEDVGAELFRNEQDAAKGISGHEIAIVPGQVELELLGDTESYHWTAVIGFARFATADDECCIFGHAGGLEFFLASFDGVARAVKLKCRSNLPTKA